jgi:hypothetical protein
MVADGFNGKTGSIVLNTTVVSLNIRSLHYGFAAMILMLKATLYSRQFEWLEIKIKSCH